MIEEVAAHYSGGGGLAEKIAESLRQCRQRPQRAEGGRSINSR